MLFGEEAVHPGEANVRAILLLKEANEKIPKWRGEAIRDLIQPQNMNCLEALPVWKVVRAAALADEHHDNSFRRLKVLRKRLRIFGLASFIITIFYVGLAQYADLMPKIAQVRRDLVSSEFWL